MAHVEGGEKYYIRKEYTEVSRLDDKKEEPKIVVQPVQTGQQEQPAGGEETEPPQQDDKGQKGSGENAV